MAGAALSGVKSAGGEAGVGCGGMGDLRLFLEMMIPKMAATDNSVRRKGPGSECGGLRL